MYSKYTPPVVYTRLTNEQTATDLIEKLDLSIITK